MPLADRKMYGLSCQNCIEKFANTKNVINFSL